MDSSKFNLWRACFLFCLIDGVITEKEKAWIDEKVKTLPFNDEQKKTLMADTKRSPSIDELLTHITRPADKGFLVDQMRYISKIDGTLNPLEKAKIEEIKNKVLSNIDLDSIEKKVSEVTGSFVESLHSYIKKS